jgi:hypothetical protein
MKISNVIIEGMTFRIGSKFPASYRLTVQIVSELYYI